MGTLPLDQSASVILDGSGNGRVILSPLYGQRWDLTTETLSTISQAAPLPIGTIYAPAPSQLASTFTGNGDQAALPATVYGGQQIIATWTGGNPGDTATLRVQGTITTGYRGGTGNDLAPAAGGCGSGFTNDAIGGITLVRPAIRSPNYVPGVSGWSINEDGSAEFDDLTFRGQFEGTDFLINSAGVFFYSPSPGAGNLIASIASSSGTDGYGNTYRAGITNYTGAGHVAQLLAGALFVDDPNGTDWSVSAFLAGSTPYLAVGNANNNTVAYFDANGNLLANQPGVFSTPETWHAATLAGAWTNTGGSDPVAQYRKTVAPPNSVEIIGSVTGGGNSTLFTLPTAYRPAHNLSFPVFGTPATGAIPRIAVLTSGVVETLNTSGTGTVIFHHTIPLDA